MSLKTYAGSCHCGAMRFECEVDLAAGTGRCNCSYCAKARGWGATAKPDTFRITAGKDAVFEYQFGTKVGHHCFCKICGIRCFGYGHLDVLGGDFVSVAVACLDDVPVEQLTGGPITYQNGRNNAWWNTPAETVYL
jgi:hypothetical protein